ncbi:hypothetical protein F4778DRAFT_54406 [Xylariomycetidae sp. FL2044]|nr:hypothetical protein F4778DRAFT_54406 [Xylariomycetidae sp. FL2044]
MHVASPSMLIAAILSVLASSMPSSSASRGSQAARQAASLDAEPPLVWSTIAPSLLRPLTPPRDEPGCPKEYPPGTGEECVADQWTCQNPKAVLVGTKAIVTWNDEKGVWQCQRGCLWQPLPDHP